MHFKDSFCVIILFVLFIDEKGTFLIGEQADTYRKPVKKKSSAKDKESALVSNFFQKNMVYERNK